MADNRALEFNGKRLCPSSAIMRKLLPPEVIGKVIRHGVRYERVSGHLVKGGLRLNERIHLP